MYRFTSKIATVWPTLCNSVLPTMNPAIFFLCLGFHSHPPVTVLLRFRALYKEGRVVFLVKGAFYPSSYLRAKMSPAVILWKLRPGWQLKVYILVNSINWDLNVSNQTKEMPESWHQVQKWHVPFPLGPCCAIPDWHGDLMRPGCFFGHWIVPSITTKTWMNCSSRLDFLSSLWLN